MAPSSGNELPGYDHSVPTGEGASRLKDTKDAKTDLLQKETKVRD